MKKSNNIIFLIILSLAFTNFSCKKSDISPNSNIQYGKMTDLDGNEYKTVKIGTQIWMAENLRVTRFRNGDQISQSFSRSDLSTPKYLFYNFDPSYNIPHGKLYNLKVVEDIRQIAPSGWHIPSIQEWTTLINYLGGMDAAGEKLKSSNLWTSSSTQGTNGSGFNALPGGMYAPVNYFDGFVFFGSRSEWWSTTLFLYSQSTLRTVSMYYDTNSIGVSGNKSAHYIRLIKN